MSNEKKPKRLYEHLKTKIEEKEAIRTSHEKRTINAATANELRSAKNNDNSSLASEIRARTAAREKPVGFEHSLKADSGQHGKRIRAATVQQGKKINGSTVRKLRSAKKTSESGSYKHLRTAVSKNTSLKTARLNESPNSKGLRTSISQNKSKADSENTLKTAQIKVARELKTVKPSDSANNKLSAGMSKPVRNTEKLVKGEYNIKHRINRQVNKSPKFVKRRFNQTKYKTGRSRIELNKALTTPVAKQAVKTATLKTAVVNGNALKTTVNAGSEGFLKTARSFTDKVIGATDSALSRSDNEEISAIGHSVRYSYYGTRTAGKALYTTAQGGIKTAQGTQKSVRTVKSAVRTVKTQGLKKSAVNFARKTVEKIAAQSAKLAVVTVKAVVPKVLPAIIIIIAIAAGASQMSVPIQGIAGFIQSTLGWLFKESDKNKVDEKSAFQILIERVDMILSSEELKEAHRAVIEIELEKLDSFSVDDDGNERLSDSALLSLGMDESEYEDWLSSLFDGADVPADATFDGYVFDKTVDWGRYEDSFRIHDYSTFFIMAFFDKFSEDKEFNDANLEFTDSELKEYLIIEDQYTESTHPLSLPMFPVLRDVIIPSVATSVNVYGETITFVVDGETHYATQVHYTINILVIYRPLLTNYPTNPYSYTDPYTHINIFSDDFLEKYDFAVMMFDMFMGEAETETEEE